MNKIIFSFIGTLGGGILGDLLAKVISHNLYSNGILYVSIIIIITILGGIVGYKASKDLK